MLLLKAISHIYLNAPFIPPNEPSKHLESCPDWFTRLSLQGEISTTSSSDSFHPVIGGEETVEVLVSVQIRNNLGSLVSSQ